MTRLNPTGVRRSRRRAATSLTNVEPGRRAEFGFVVVHESSRGTVVWLRGELEVSAAPALLQRLIETLNLPLDRLTIDMAEVRDIDDHGVAALVAAHKRARTRGVAFVLDAVPPVVREALQPTDLAQS
jgi:anti-anti-sigma factor